MRKLVVFLGAGASRVLGYPLTDDLLRRMLRRLKRGRLFEPALFQEEASLRRYLRSAFPGFWKGRAPAIGITELLTLLDYYIADPKTHLPWRKIRRAELPEFRSLLATGICELLHDGRHGLSAPAKQRWLASLARLVEGSGPRLKLDFITTNYDTVVDEILGRQFGENLPKNVDLGLRWARISKDYERFQECRRPTRAPVSYFKLHGSLDWLACPNPRCRKLLVSSGREHIYLVPHQYRSDASTCFCGTFPLKQTIVAPSHFRDLKGSRLLEIWHSARKSLRDADRILIVGYSMPPEDAAIKDLLMGSLLNRRKGRKPKVEIVIRSNGPHERLRYEQYFGGLGDRCRVYSGGVEDYLDGKDTVLAECLDAIGATGKVRRVGSGGSH